MSRKHRTIPAAVSILLLLASFCPFCSEAQQNKLSFSERSITAKAITIDDGLSQGMINDIIQDRNGFLWFATKDGLNKYDGYTFKIYRNNPEDDRSISDNHITRLFEDSKGNIWTGSITGKIDRFDIHSETFTHFKYTGKTKVIVQIWSFVELDDGTLLAQGCRTFRVNPALKKFDDYPLPALTEISSILDKNRIIATHGSKISLLNRATGKSLEKDLLQEIQPFRNENNVPALKVSKEGSSEYFNTITMDSVNQMIHIVFKSGLISLDLNTLETKLLFPTAKLINSITVIGKNKIWINIDENLYEFEPDKMLMTRITLRESSTIDANALAILKDKTGIYWIGTRGYGIIKYNPRNEVFNNIPMPSVTSIVEMAGMVQVGHNPIIFNFDPIRKKVTDTFSLFDMYNSGYVRTGHPPAIDKEGNLWSVEYQNLTKREPKTGTKKTWTLPQLEVSFYDIVHGIAFDPRGIVWLGTSTGLIRFDPSTGDSRTFNYNSKDPESISNDCIYSICYDRDSASNILWLGTNGGGLTRFNTVTFKADRFGTKDGLPNAVVYGILQENSGELWMSTNLGLSRFDPSQKTFTNFTINDGLQSNEFNRYSYFKTSDGTMYFGGINGLNFFKPEMVRNSSEPPPVAITEIYVGNKPLRDMDTTLHIPKTLYDGRSITLPYKRNIFTINFTALDFAATEENQYKYKLSGFNEDWVDVGTANSATFTNLDPGTYTFTVIARNKYGVWNNKGASLTIRILPPWYLTWWFRVLVVSALIGIIVLIYRYRLNSALKVMKVRNDIARDLHDEIGSNLSNISIFSNIANTYQNHPKTAELLKKVSDYSQYSLASLQDIVWMISSRNDNIEQTIARMKRLAYDVFESLDCKLIMNIDDSIMDMKINMEDRKNLYLLFKESLNNIAKHAGASETQISMFRDKNRIRLQIRDNGIGIDSQHQKGNGLYNLKNRASALHGDLKIFTAKHNGTMIDLSFIPNK